MRDTDRSVWSEEDSRQAQELFARAEEKYQDTEDGFPWGTLTPEEDMRFVRELGKELSPDDPLLRLPVHAVARSYEADDVLFWTGRDGEGDLFRIYHLTYQACAGRWTPRFEEFRSLRSVLDFIEQDLSEDGMHEEG